MECLAFGRIAFKISDNGGDPNGVEAHILDIIQMINDTSPRPATILPRLRIALSPVIVRERESVRDHLHNIPLKSKL